jgi:phosphonate transport system ATP-binding protein
MNSAPVLELDAVTVRFGAHRALQNVSLRIDAGERVALCGPSGAGKSTLLGVLNGSIHAESGAARIFGMNWHALSGKRERTARRRIATVHQQLHLIDSLSALHNVNAGRLAEWSLLRTVGALFAPPQAEDGRSLLARVGIAEKLHARVDSLSGGERQRVALARALAQQPDALLADEPVSSLDPARARDILRLLTSLCDSPAHGNSRRTLVVSLHSFELAIESCSRVIGLRDGMLVFDKASNAVTAADRDALYAIATPLSASAPTAGQDVYGN